MKVRHRESIRSPFDCHTPLASRLANEEFTTAILRVAFCLADFFYLAECGGGIEGGTVGFDLAEEGVDVVVAVRGGVGGGEFSTRLTNGETDGERAVEAGARGS